MRARLVSVWSLACLLASCGGAAALSDAGVAHVGLNCQDRTGGSEIQLAVDDESFRFWSTNGAFIARAKDLKASGRTGIAMFGKLFDGLDRDTQWTFHVDVSDVSWLNLAVDGCNARPSEVERDKKHWIDDIERWCPWNVHVLGVEDC